MIKKLVTLIIFAALAYVAQAQQLTTETGKFWIYFNDKGPEASAILANYREYLPKAMVEAHTKRGIGITGDDLPVSKTYLEQLSRAGYKVTGKSRWLNAAVIDAEAVDAQILKAACPSVTKVVPMAEIQPMSHNMEATYVEKASLKSLSSLPYGMSAVQNTIIGLDCMHDNGFTGAGIKIAVLDNSFRKIDSCTAFDYIHTNNHIKARYNTLDSSNNINGASGGHGTAVTSIISAYVPDTMLGSAFDADLYLVVAEEPRAPYHDIYFVNAAEWADAQGVDIIQSSLGYIYPPGGTPLAAGLEYYTHDHLDGHSTPITKAAQKAAGKGILFVNAVGDNFFGNIIFSPSDGDSVLAVGGVTSSGSQSPGTTYQLTADGRLRPDVDALGTDAYVMGYNGVCGTKTMNGASLSAPAISAFAACLMQAHPSANSWLISQAIKFSSSFGANLHDSTVVYGIPNACRADSLLNIGWTGIDTLLGNENTVQLSPIPATSILTAKGDFDTFTKVQLYNMLGQELNIKYSLANRQKLELNTADLSPGMYLLTLISKDGNIKTNRFIKQ